MADRIADGVALGMTFKEAAKAGWIHEHTLEKWRKRGARERDSNSIYSRFLGQIDRAAEKTAIAYLEAIRQSIMENPEKVRKHIKKDESGKVILTEIHRETLPPDIKGAMWWLERRFPEQFGRREQMEHTGKVDVQATQIQERKLTIELVKSDGEVHRLTRDDVMTAAVTVEAAEPEPPYTSAVVPPPYTSKPRRCEGCQTPITLPRHTRTTRCPKCQKVYAHSRNVTQGALRYVKLKAEGPMADVLDRGVRSRSEDGAREALCGPCRALAQGPGHDGTDPKAGALSRRVFDRGVRAAAPRTGLVLASLAAMAPPRRPASVALPTVHRRRAVAP